MASPTDEELMAGFCRGEEGAFDQLFERHSSHLHSFLSNMVRDTALAEDLLQITFLSLVRSRHRYEQGTKVLPWLVTIAANAARDSQRRKRSAVSHLRNESATAEKSVDPEPSDPGLRKQLSAALEQLPQQQREAVVLHKVEGWSFDEIARATGITETAARIRAHRGYEKLRHLLGSVVETSS